MIKRSMLAVFAAAFVFAALPAIASAVKISNPNVHFTIDGSTALLETVGGTKIHCQTTAGEPAGVTGTGQFETSTTGKVEFTFHDCRGSFNITCNSSGQPSGTIATGTLPFHLKTVGGKPAVLITPRSGEPFATFNCSAFVSVVVSGNGIIGTITAPKVGESSTEATVAFEQTKGVQAHKKVDGEETTYNLKSSINGGAAEEAAEQATGTLTFTESVKLEE